MYSLAVIRYNIGVVRSEPSETQKTKKIFGKTLDKLQTLWYNKYIKKERGANKWKR